MINTVSLEGNMFDLTLSWEEPFNNFDPIVNYTVSCLGACTPNFTTTDNSTRSYNVANLDINTNYTFTVVATNSLGSGEPAMFMTTPLSVPNEITGLSLACGLSQTEFYYNCTAAWNAVTIGNEPLNQPLVYTVYYNGSSENVTSPTTHLAFRAPSFPEGYFVYNVTVSVTAINRFGAGPPSEDVSDEIMAPSTVRIIATPNTDTPSNRYDYTIICTIHPESEADTCEVTVRSGDMSITNRSAVTNGNATILISELNCLEVYTVTAGGTLEGALVGPRSSHEAITTGDCMIPTAMLEPDQVTGINLTCEISRDGIEINYNCTAEWDPVVMGNNSLEQPLVYRVDYNGSLRNVTSPTTSVWFGTQPVQIPGGDFVYNVTISVTAINRFGAGPPSDNVSAEIMEPSVVGIIATPNTNTPSNRYDYTIICTIHPESEADTCEVTFRRRNISITNSSAVNATSRNATVIIFGLNCLNAYIVTAGGTLDGNLVGPRLLNDRSVITGPCVMSINPTTSTMIVTATSTAVGTVTPTPTGGNTGGAAMGTTWSLILIALTNMITMMM